MRFFILQKCSGQILFAVDAKLTERKDPFFPMFDNFPHPFPIPQPPTFRFWLFPEEILVGNWGRLHFLFVPIVAVAVVALTSVSSSKKVTKCRSRGF